MNRPRKDKTLPPKLHFKHGAYYYTPYVNGKVKWIRLSDQLGDALRLWAEHEGDTDTPNTVNQAIDQYLLHRTDHLKPKTLEGYKENIAKIRPVFGDMPLNEVTKPHINEYLRKRGGVIANREMQVLGYVYKYAVSVGSVSDNPCKGEGLYWNKEQKRKYVPTHDEINQIRELANDQWKCIIDMVLLTALRKTDVFNIRLSDITPDGLRVHISKTGETVTYTYTDALRDVLRRSRKIKRSVGSMYLFCNRYGRQHKIPTVNKAWHKLKNRAGLPQVRFHDLRARAVTDARAARGRDYAQDLAGHADGSMTERYVREREIRKVVPLK